jgi:hypothetical protein
MKLTIALAVAAATQFTAARVIKVLHSPDHVSISHIDEPQPPARLATRNLVPSRPKITFWDDDYATQQDWDEYAYKGGALMCGLEGDDETAGGQMKDTRTPPSARTQFNGDLKTELQNCYWRDTNPSTFSCRLAEHWHFPNVMRSLGLDGRPASEGGDNTCYRVEHWDPEKRDDKGNQVAAINQWYNVPGIERQYHVHILCHLPLRLLTVPRRRKRTMNSASTKRAEQSTASSSRVRNLPPKPSGSPAAKTQPKMTSPNSAPSRTCSGASGTAITIMSGIYATSS